MSFSQAYFRVVYFLVRLRFSNGWIQLLAMIGEQFDYGDEICGAVVNVRARQEKIALWTKNAPNEAAQVCLSKLDRFFMINSMPEVMHHLTSCWIVI